MYSKSERRLGAASRRAARGPLFISALKSSLHGRSRVMPAGEGNQFLRDLVVTVGEITAAFERLCRGVRGKHQGLPLCIAWSWEKKGTCPCWGEKGTTRFLKNKKTH